MSRFISLIGVVIILCTPSFAQQNFLVFPQFAAGDGLSSEIVLVNADNNQAQADFQIYNEDGTSPKDLPDGAVRVIPANGTRSLSLTAFGAAHVGSIAIITSSRYPYSAPIFGSLKITIAGLGSSSVQQGQTGNTFVVPVQKTSDLRTGIAIANVCPFIANGTVTLRSQDGLPIGIFPFRLQPNGHVSKFIDEMIPAISAPFVGVASIVGNGTNDLCISTLSVAAYDLGSSLGQFIVLPAGKVN